MINYRSLQVAIAQVLKELTGNNIVWSNQNANTPDGDYLLLKISSVRFIGGTDYESKPNLNGKIKTQGDREVVLSVLSVSQNSMEILLDLVNKLNLNLNLKYLSSRKLAYVGLDGDIADITIQINNSFESRASVEMIFRISKNYTSDIDDEIGIIEAVEMSGNFNGNGVEEPLEINLEIKK